MFSFLGALALANCATLRAQIATYETATAGTSVTLSVTADGAPAPTFQWTREGVAIPGATGTTLVLPSVTAKDNGVYNAVATNEHGWELSNDLILTVTAANVAPAITLQPFPSASALVGASLTLNVDATGNPTPTYQWRKNGVSIAGATGPTLLFPSLSLGDSATYSVVVSNSAGSVTSNNSVITVTAPAPTVNAPSFTSQPESRTAKTGATVTFNATVAGTAPFTFQWYKDGVAIPGATALKLSIKPMKSSHVGNYTLKVQNAAGSATSLPATLTLR